MHKLPELESRFKNIEEQGKLLSAEMPEHNATIEMGLQQLYDKWKNLSDDIDTKHNNLKSAREYFDMVETTERFLKEANKNLLEWSKKLSSSAKETDIVSVISVIESYLEHNKAIQNELLVRMTTAAGQVFGTSSFQKTTMVQKEQEETLNAINTILAQAKDVLLKLKLKEGEKLKEAITVTHHTQTESTSPPPRPPLPKFDSPTFQGLHILDRMIAMTLAST